MAITNFFLFMNQQPTSRPANKLKAGKLLKNVLCNPI